MVKFTVLVENKEACDLAGEHGLSVYIEHNGRKLLLDAGQSDVFVRNSRKLGCDLTKVDAAILSHAHYDHAGGFGAFFEANTEAPLYARMEGKAMDCWSVGETQRYIGIPEELFRKHRKRFVWVCKLTELYPGAWLVPHTAKGLEKIGERTGMFRKRENGLVPDDFAHEQSLVLETEQGLVIFNSCSHGGVANIVQEVRRVFGDRQVYAYIGGFHLKAPGKQEGMNCSEEEVRLLGRSLLELGIKQIYTGHCTGESGYKLLKQEMGSVLCELRTGLTAELQNGSCGACLR